MIPVLMTLARAHTQVLAHALRTRIGARAPDDARGQDAGARPWSW